MLPLPVAGVRHHCDGTARARYLTWPRGALNDDARCLCLSSPTADDQRPSMADKAHSSSGACLPLSSRHFRPTSTPRSWSVLSLSILGGSGVHPVVPVLAQDFNEPLRFSV